MEAKEELDKQEDRDKLWQKQFEQDFRKYLEPVKDEIPRDWSGKLHILSVGCGNTGGLEANPLLRIFPESDYKGIDIDDKEIERAKKYLKFTVPEGTSRISYEVEDAKNVEDGEKGRYGLVVIRNPQLLGYEYLLKSWTEIFSASVKKMVPGGYILVPTLDSKETVVDYFKKTGIEILTDEHLYEKSPLTYNSEGDVVLARKTS